MFVSLLDIFEMWSHWVFLWVQVISLPQTAEQLGLQACTSKTLCMCVHVRALVHTLALTLLHMSMADLSF